MEEQNDILDKATNALKNESAPTNPAQELIDSVATKLTSAEPAKTRTIQRRKSIRMFTKIAAAAAVIIAVVAVGLMLWLRGGKPQVKIPPQLAKMPVEELLKIHFGKTASPFDSSVVAAALAKAMDRLSPRQVVVIGQEYAAGEGLAPGTIATLPPALSRIVEACDFVVHARADEVTLDASDHKAAILKKKLDRYSYDHFWTAIRVNVKLQILQAYPPGRLIDGAELDLRPVISVHHLDQFEQGKEYLLIALKNHKDMFWLLKGNEGVYPIDPNSRMVTNLRNGQMPLDEAWEFVMDAYDAIHEGTLPPGEVLDYWLEKLQSDNITDCLTAVEYFNTLAEPTAPQELVMDAMERFLTGQIVDSEQSSDEIPVELRPSCFTAETLELLIHVADEPTIDRMLALYQREADSSMSRFSEEGYRPDRETAVSKIIRLALKHPGAKRRERILQLLSIFSEKDRRSTPLTPDDGVESALKELDKTRGGDIDQLLMDMLEDPAKFGISNSDVLGLLTTALAQRGLAEFGADPEHFLADPEMGRKEAIQHLLDLYRQGKIPIELMANLLQPEDTELISFLREALPNNHGIATLIADVLPDPCFVPVLRAELEKEVSGELLRALFACGQVQKAVEIGLAELEKPVVNDGDRWPLYRDLEKRASIIKFLGTTQQASVLPMIEKFSRQEYKQSYREIFAQLDAPPYCIDEPQEAAVSALGWLGSKEAIPCLKELYGSDDIYMQVHAALSLYRLGDDSGFALLEHFVNGTEHSLPEVKMKCGWGSHRVFRKAILSHRSPTMDALLLKTFRSKHFHPGIDYHIAHKISYQEYVFAKQYERELLPVLVEQLNNRDRTTRRYVNALLKQLTGKDFGFKPDKFVFQQTEAIERWRGYVDNYIAETAQPAE
jgi:hypothetical protein